MLAEFNYKKYKVFILDALEQEGKLEMHLVVKTLKDNEVDIDALPVYEKRDIYRKARELLESDF